MIAMNDPSLLPDGARPQVEAQVRGKSPGLLKAAALFATGLAATAVLMGPGDVKIGDAIGQMQARADGAGLTMAKQDSAATAALPQVSDVVSSATGPVAPARPALGDVDLARVQVLSRPVPSDTKAAAEIGRAIPEPQDQEIQLPSAEQTQVLAYGKFAPIVARVFSNVTKHKETHWTLHPWDVARLADQAASELYKEKRIRVDPRLIAGAYYTESGGVVQVGFDRKGVDMINKGHSIEKVVQSGSKASFGLFQIDQQHAGASDVDPLKGAKRAGEFLAEGQDNLRRFPQLGMLAVSATYNASSKLRAKIFTGAAMDERELEALEGVRRHAASMSYGAAIYDLAHRTYQQHLTQAQRMGLPIAVAADQVKRVDPLKDERVGAVYSLTGRQAIVPAERAPMPATAVAGTPMAAAPPIPKSAQVHVPAAETLAQALRTGAAAKPPTVLTAVAAPAQSLVAPAARPRPVASHTQRPATTKPPAIRSGQPRATHDHSQGEFVGGRMNGVDFGGAGVAQRVENVMPPAQRVRSAFQATTSEWRNTSSDLLGRVAAFHQQRTREMTTQAQGQQEAP
ncbi:hypothetical protein [Variovorax gossypii]